MVASTHWLASAAGMAVLERGGNAFDAAVATGFTLQVVEPHLNGPGGEVPALLWPVSRGEPIALCGQGVAPAAATIERYRELGHELVPGTGVLAACVPGAFAAGSPCSEQLAPRWLQPVPPSAYRLRGSRFPSSSPSPAARSTAPRSSCAPGPARLSDPACPPRLARSPATRALAATDQRIVDRARGGSREEEIEMGAARVLRGLRRRGDRPLRRRRGRPADRRRHGPLAGPRSSRSLRSSTGA